MTGGDLLAHGIGGQKDLPIPLNLTIAGGVAALVISFTVLAVAWRKPRYDAARDGRPAPVALQRLVASSGFRIALRVFGMVLFLFAGFCAVFGRDSAINPFFGIFYIWLWVGLVPMSLLFGPFYRAISPVRTINLLFATLARTDPDEGLYRYPARLGLWPAAIGLYAFVWLELVYPFMAELGAVRFWCAVYVAIMLIGGALFGNTFYAHADPFEVYSTLVGKLSVWAVRDGQLLLRSPLANLSSVAAVPGLFGVMGVLFGSTGFDSFGESIPWVTFVQGSSINGEILKNLALLVFCLGAMAVLSVGSMLTGVDDPDRASRTWPSRSEWRTPWRAVGPAAHAFAGAFRARAHLPSAFAFSLVPIVVGYVIAHYLTYLLEIGSRTLRQASDPLSKGWNILGTGDLGNFAWLSYHPTLLATIKVLAVVTGHVLAAIVAHDRALRLLPERHQLTGQLPLLFAMVGFTGGGLYLLFAA